MCSTAAVYFSVKRASRVAKASRGSRSSTVLSQYKQLKYRGDETYWVCMLTELRPSTGAAGPVAGIVPAARRRSHCAQFESVCETLHNGIF